MYSIGMYSELTGLSKKTLRHYEKIGLHIPDIKNFSNGYRYYSDIQLVELNKIIALKEVGFSLREIGETLQSNPDTEELVKILKDKRKDIKSNIELEMNKISRLDTHVKNLIGGDSILKESNSYIHIYPASKHYDLLATIEADPPCLVEYMAQWDGPDFFKYLEPIEGRRFLEVGIGLGRIAAAVLKNNGRVTGIDVSPRSIECAKFVLGDFGERLSLINVGIEDFSEKESYDIVYSVLTFLHIQNKRKALEKMVDAIKPGGRIVLSVEVFDADYEGAVFLDGDIRYKPERFWNDIDDFISIIGELGCKIIHSGDLLKRIPDEGNEPVGKLLAILIVAEKCTKL